MDNLSQLQSVAAEFEQNTPDATLAGFLETTALVADSDRLPGEGEDSGKVTMMTLHTAKGLEYPYVFLTGMEQGTFPHQRAIEDTSELSEERRLAYVGITRAKRRLYVTRAAVRAQWGQANDMMPSQFLDEIPDELIDWKRREAGVERMRASWGDDDEFGGWDDDDDFGSLPSADRCTDRRHTVPHRMVLVLAISSHLWVVSWIAQLVWFRTVLLRLGKPPFLWRIALWLVLIRFVWLIPVVIRLRQALRQIR